MSIDYLCLYKPKMLALKPLPGRVLVEIRGKYEYVATEEKKYDTKTSGVCIDSNNPNFTGKNYVPSYLNKLVFWEEYKEGAIIKRDDKEYAFIKIEDLAGYEDVEAN